MAAWRELEVGLAVVTLLAPLPFLLTIGVAVILVARGRRVGERLGFLLALTGGLTVGLLIASAGDLLLAAPAVLVPGWVVWSRWREGRRRQAGWLLVGLALPWTVYRVLLVLTPPAGPGGVPDAAPEHLGALLLGVVPLVVGVRAVLRPDPEPPQPRMDARAGQPGSRSIESIAAAIREPAMIGPFGLPELALIVALVATTFVVGFLVPREWPFLVHLAIQSVASSVVAAEAYIRAMPSRSRRAFESFSWLGEWELARAKQVTGRGVPTTPIDAEQWLVDRPERLSPIEEAFLRVEVLLFAGRIDEARALMGRIEPRATSPYELFEVAALRDLVSWRGGGDGDLAGMQAAAEEVLPADGDDRLRAEVTIAVAKVRRLMADGRSGAGDAAQPLLDVRERLGRRADGQVGRALRHRLIPVLIIVGVVFGLLLGATGGVSGLGLG